VQELSRKGRRGVGVMRRLLDKRPGGKILDRSELERQFFQLLVDNGLPPPVRNHRVRIGGDTFEIDLAYPEQRIAIEVDSEERHMDLHHFHRDRKKMSRLATVGRWIPVWLTSERLAAPDELIAELSEALRRAAS
jgi:hypothetical protein